MKGLIYLEELNKLYASREALIWYASNSDEPWTHFENTVLGIEERIKELLELMLKSLEG